MHEIEELSPTGDLDERSILISIEVLMYFFWSGISFAIST